MKREEVFTVFKKGNYEFVVGNMNHIQIGKINDKNVYQYNKDKFIEGLNLLDDNQTYYGFPVSFLKYCISQC